eukprot:CAMPEP_0113572638 /NCGR_PEP_ID=MMETSP0015_2-20120614/26197_1 /TAXON_ID=2838 /ORGANISM="Odontella" /LENGTH=307 /DNA_ID=CAMNT_0000475675 /DNA_START=135 /DNA_END=1058 /DNA_ORIENTATION=- /assembly_acc=CAM_ASM_000160
MSSLPSVEEVRMSAGPGRSQGGKSCCRRILSCFCATLRCLFCTRWIGCVACLAVIALIVGISVELTGKDAMTLAGDTYDAAEGVYDEYFGKKRDDPTEEDRGSIAVTSRAFDYGDVMPDEYTSGGADVSPPLAWDALPPGTESLVVLVEDHDFPTPDNPRDKPWVHWVAYDINPDLTGLPGQIPRDAAVPTVKDPDTGESMSAGAPKEEKKENDDGTTQVTLTPQPMRQGSTSWKNDSGYRGPDPPEGSAHRYYFRVMALDDTIEDKIEDRDAKEYVTYDDILEIVEGDDAKVKVLAFGLLMGTYGI